MVQAWLKTNLKFWDKTLRSPSSPDLNSLDYTIWAYLQSRVNVCRYPKIETLKAAISQEWAKMSVDFTMDMGIRFWARLEAIMAAKGGFID